MELRRFLVILTAALVILLIVVIWFFPSDEDFRTENPFWNGAREMNSSYPATTLESLSALPSPPHGATLIIIPYLAFTPDELKELSSFVTRGGTLILADDYGHGNQILANLGLKARFARQSLLDPLSNYRNKWFPMIPHFNPSALTINIDSLVFNHATCLTGVEAEDALALSSSFSFLDANGNQAWDEGEPAGSLPVISHHKLGDGLIILISDPSIFINSMEKMEDNQNFIQNIATATTSGLLIDQSHLPPSNLHRTKNLLAQTRRLLATPLGTTGLVLLALSITLKPIWHKRTTSSIERR